DAPRLVASPRRVRHGRRVRRPLVVALRSAEMTAAQTVVPGPVSETVRRSPRPMRVERGLPAVVLASTGALLHLIHPGSWLVEVAGLVLGLSGLAALGRRTLRRRPWTTSVLLVIVATWALVVLHARPGELTWVPTWPAVLD